MSLHSNRTVTSILDLIGDTPLIRLRSVERRAGGDVQIWAKCEFENPGGSVKDRAARQMVVDALDDGRLGPGKTLIDSTSGNTGVAYSMIGAALGIPITLVMPAHVSEARKNITRAYGTTLIGEKVENVKYLKLGHERGLGNMHWEQVARVEV